MNVDITRETNSYKAHLKRLVNDNSYQTQLANEKIKKLELELEKINKLAENTNRDCDRIKAMLYDLEMVIIHYYSLLYYNDREMGNNIFEGNPKTGRVIQVSDVLPEFIQTMKNDSSASFGITKSIVAYRRKGKQFEKQFYVVKYNDTGPFLEEFK